MYIKKKKEKKRKRNKIPRTRELVYNRRVNISLCKMSSMICTIKKKVACNEHRCVRTGCVS